ncbi:hypothetical protein NDU88_004556 [Pleurodeles waltl]|uniref:Uncharacterized protein n=1 Tax=Pleurodeles waltl TaxID=8319 RepID=A0AAV7LUZ3_PLEWA|nr:hypothetical protein NDU88_004556 [Pleurodeles waltl]
MQAYVLPQQIHGRRYPDGPDMATAHSASAASSARLAGHCPQPHAARFCPAQRCTAETAVGSHGGSGRLSAAERQVMRGTGSSNYGMPRVMTVAPHHEGLPG